MKKPRLVLNTDDSKSMNSELHVTVTKSLDRVELLHIKQWGSDEVIQVFPSQIDSLVKFLQEAEIWIKSGYKEKLKPESYNEFKAIKKADS